ncbi:hypothetical protein [Bacillus anthracis]|nr:hypothetical protein [Bacillus anthracis]
MRVQEILLKDKIKRYLLVDQSGTPVMPVTRYLKYLDATVTE